MGCRLMRFHSKPWICKSLKWSKASRFRLMKITIRKCGSDLSTGQQKWVSTCQRWSHLRSTSLAKWEVSPTHWQFPWTRSHGNSLLSGSQAHNLTQVPITLLHFNKNEGGISIFRSLVHLIIWQHESLPTPIYFTPKKMSSRNHTVTQNIFYNTHRSCLGF